MAATRLGLLAIGVDGLSLRVVSPWVEAGRLPNLKALMDRGSWGVLKSTVPPLTPPAWYASLTGVNPGRQNIFGFFRAPRQRYAKVPVTAADLRAPAVWDYLGRAGRTSAVLYLPLSYPPRPLRGYMVSGFMTPDGARDYANPPELAAELEGAVPGFRLNLDHGAIRLGKLGAFYREALEVLDRQTAAAIHLMAARPTDFFFVHLHDVDSVTHLFWKYQDPAHPGYRRGNPYESWLQDYYRAVDGAVGRLAAAAGPDVPVLLYSDHGFMPVYRQFSVNRWLADHGYLRLKREGTLELKSALGSLGLGKERIKSWASKLGLEGLLRHLPKGLKRILPQTRFSFNDLADHVDWPGTRAYFLSASEGSLYANIRGREPEGVLAGGEGEALLERIREELLRETDPANGGKVLAAAHLRWEVYHGEYAGNSPDLVLLPADGYYFSENARGPLVADQGLEKHQISANHHPDGVVMAAGWPFTCSSGRLAADIKDVAPTILRALGEPVPMGLDGRVIETVFDSRFLDRTAPRYAEPIAGTAPGDGRELPPEETRKIIGNLEGLGYY